MILVRMCRTRNDGWLLWIANYAVRRRLSLRWFDYRSSYPVNENSYPANGEHSYATNGERSYTNGNGQLHGNGQLPANGQFSSNGQHYPMNHHVPSVTDHLPLKTSDNGVSPIVLTPVSESGPYPTKDIPEVRTPQLPFGENVKLAAGITP